MSLAPGQDSRPRKVELMMTDAFSLTFTAEGLPVAYAKMVREDRGKDVFAYMEVPQCPLCGEKHVLAAESLYQDGEQIGFAASYSKRDAPCTPEARKAWARQHPETVAWEAYMLMPEPVRLPAARRGARGSSVVGLALMFIPMLFLIDLISCIAIGGHAQVNVAAAARSCVRMAAATLSTNLGPAQGEQVGMDALKAAGLGRRDPQVSVRAQGSWDRGGTVSCSAQVTVPFGALGLIGRLVGRHDITVHERQSTTIETWNSNWNN